MIENEQAPLLACGPLNDQDNTAFEDWWSKLPGIETGFEKSLAEVAWQGALAHRDTQAEPVAWAVIYFGGKFSGRIYTTLDSEAHAKDYVANMHQSQDQHSFRFAPIYTHPAPAVAQEPVLLVDHCEFVAARNEWRMIGYALNSIAAGTKLYTEAPAVAVTEQMLALLKTIDNEFDNFGDPSGIEYKFGLKAAIAAAEAAKKGGE